MASGLTTRLFPYPLTSDSANVATDIALLAARCDTLPGVAIMTDAARIALSGTELWAGRFVFTSDTYKLWVYRGGAWSYAENLAGGRISRVAVTANQTGITTEVDITSLTTTFTQVSSARWIRTSFKVTVQSGTLTDSVAVKITDGSATQLDIFTIPVVVASRDVTLSGYLDENPAAGSITRKLRILRSAGAGTVQMSASATNPAFISVDDLGE